MGRRISFRRSGGYDAASEGILTRQENLAGRSKGIAQSATGGDPSHLEKRGEAAYAFQSMVNI